MVKPDDLRVNQWLVITASEEELLSPFGELVTVRNRMVTGVPYKVLAISLPFVSVTDGNYRLVFDTRHVTFTKATTSYANSLRGAKPTSRGLKLPEPKKEKDKSTKKERACPNCGENLVERRIDIGSWVFACNHCGFMGGPPKEGSYA